MFKLQTIQGTESVQTLHVYQSLLIGLQLMPAYAKWDSDDFYDLIERMEPEDQKKVFWDAAKTIPLDSEEIDKFLYFYKDPNGVPLSKANTKTMNPMQICEMIVEVCMAMAKMKVDFVTEEEKKKSQTSQ